MSDNILTATRKLETISDIYKGILILYNMENVIIRPARKNKANGQIQVSVGKLAKEGDFLVIRKLNISETESPILADELSAPNLQNGQD
jgi:hypothetical protein